MEKVTERCRRSILFVANHHVLGMSAYFDFWTRIGMFDISEHKRFPVFDETALYGRSLFNIFNS